MAVNASLSELATLPLRIDCRRIGYLKFILEGYDNMALVTTLNAREGMIVLRYPPSFHDELLAIIDDLSPLIFQSDAK
jgi:hypothetical protein